MELFEIIDVNQLGGPDYSILDLPHSAPIWIWIHLLTQDSHVVGGRVTPNGLTMK
jgi:hypothetical protein